MHASGVGGKRRGRGGGGGCTPCTPLPHPLQARSTGLQVRRTWWVLGLLTGDRLGVLGLYRMSI